MYLILEKYIFFLQLIYLFFNRVPLSDDRRGASVFIIFIQVLTLDVTLSRRVILPGWYYLYFYYIIYYNIMCIARVIIYSPSLFVLLPFVCSQKINNCLVFSFNQCCNHHNIIVHKT